METKHFLYFIFIV